MDSFEGMIWSLRNEYVEKPLIESAFVAPGIFERPDVVERQAKLARIVSAEIVPRLIVLHTEVLAPAESEASHPRPEEITRLAELVLSPDVHAAAAYVTLLRDRGLDMDTLFVELLEPAARRLGRMWDEDECDFIDVTLGLGRLQKLLAIFNCTHALPALNARRRVLTLSTPGDQHFFGLTMVNKFLAAGGWTVDSAFEPTLEGIGESVHRDWFAVAGVTLGSERHLDTLRETIATIRAQSLNPAIGIMVGGSLFKEQPDLAGEIGADATAIDAPTAVIVAQKLFDIGVLRSVTPS